MGQCFLIMRVEWFCWLRKKARQERKTGEGFSGIGMGRGGMEFLGVSEGGIPGASGEGRKVCSWRVDKGGVLDLYEILSGEMRAVEI